jgi:hypothetical protein
MKYNRTKLVLPLPVPLGASNISNHVIFPANNSSVTVIHLDKDRAIRCPLNVIGGKWDRHGQAELSYCERASRSRKVATGIRKIKAKIEYIDASIFVCKNNLRWNICVRKEVEVKDESAQKISGSYLVLDCSGSC